MESSHPRVALARLLRKLNTMPHPTTHGRERKRNCQSSIEGVRADTRGRLALRRFSGRKAMPTTRDVHKKRGEG